VSETKEDYSIAGICTPLVQSDIHHIEGNNNNMKKVKWKSTSTLHTEMVNMDWEIKNKIKGEILEKLYIAFFKGEEGIDKATLSEIIEANTSDFDYVIDFIWDRENIKIDTDSNIIKITFKGILVVENQELADTGLIDMNLTIRENLIETFYALSEENNFGQVDSKIIVDRIGVDQNEFPIHFKIIDMMDFGSTLVNGDVLISSEGKEYFEENYE